MQLDSHGNVVNTTPKGYILNKKTGLLNRFFESSRTGVHKLTKSQRKQLRKDALTYFPKGHPKEGQIKPARTKGDKGYTYIMTVLGRGSKVSMA